MIASCYKYVERKKCLKTYTQITTNVSIIPFEYNEIAYYNKYLFSCTILKKTFH